MLAKKLISIGIPCFNEELNIIPTYQALKKLTAKITTYQFQFIFVDNGSQDKTRIMIEKIAQKDKRIKGIFLSRNFGPEASGQAMLDYAKGEAFILYEADGQDPVELIPKFIEMWEKGNDTVIGIRDKTVDNFFISNLRKIFYKVFKMISYIDIPVNAGGFALMDKKVISAMCRLPEKNRFLRGLRAWVGFKTAYIRYKRKARKRGKSSYNFYEYLKHSERGIFGFSYLILDLMIYGGLLVVFFSFIFILIYLFWVFVFGNPIKASIPLMLVIVFFGGIQLLAISIIGKYIQVIVEETKNRPVYIVDKLINK